MSQISMTCCAISIWKSIYNRKSWENSGPVSSLGSYINYKKLGHATALSLQHRPPVYIYQPQKD